MQMYVAHTLEIDDAEDAVQEILQALPLASIKGKNAVGIINTHADAVSNGIIDALANALPFDFIGMTTFATCANGQADLAMLSLTVLVSEENTFSTIITKPLDDNFKSSIAEAYTKVVKELGQKPALNFVCAPFNRELSGQEITSYITQISDNVPLFGGLASDHTPDPTKSSIFLNKENHRNAVAFLCISGPLKLDFQYVSLNPSSLQNKKAVITASEGNVVFSVNDMPVMDYIFSLGLSTESITGSGSILPFLVDYNDGSPLVAREALAITPEKHINFGGEMPKGAYIYLALQTSEEVLSTANHMLQYIEDRKNSLDCVLVVGCGGRSVILGAEPLSEALAAIKILDESLPYHQNYARGEICPATLANGKLENRFHNFSFTACLFEKA